MVNDEVKINARAWVQAESFTLKEEVSEATGEKKILLEMNLIPFGKISRNGIMYNKEATLACLDTLIGRPLLDNHSDETTLREAPPLGHFVKAWYDEASNMAKGIADVDPEEKTIINKIRRGDISHCSIQILANKAIDREVNGVSYAEAYPDEFLETSLVKVEGFGQATLNGLIAEAFKKSKNEKFVDALVGKHENNLGHCIETKVAQPVMSGGVEAKEDVSTSNVGTTVPVIQTKKKEEEQVVPQKEVEPFDLHKFLSLLTSSEDEARKYALQYV